MEPYSQTPIKESFKEKAKIFINKEGPYIIRFIVRGIADLIVTIIKSLKYLLRSFIETFKGCCF